MQPIKKKFFDTILSIWYAHCVLVNKLGSGSARNAQVCRKSLRFKPRSRLKAVSSCCRLAEPTCIHLLLDGGWQQPLDTKATSDYPMCQCNTASQLYDQLTIKYSKTIITSLLCCLLEFISLEKGQQSIDKPAEESKGKSQLHSNAKETVL